MFKQVTPVKIQKATLTDMFKFRKSVEVVRPSSFISIKQMMDFKWELFRSSYSIFLFLHATYYSKTT